MFFRFENRLIVTGYLRAETAIRIGAGKDTEVAAPDLPVLRGSTGEPLIPGSSIKGVMRSYVESLLRGVAGEGAACDPTNLDQVCISRTRYKQLLQEFKRDEAQLAQQIEQHSCMVCRIFGSNYISSHVSFFDAPTEKQSWFGQFQVRNGVAINRDSGKAADRALYDFEVVPSGSRFEFRMSAENSTDWMRGIIVSAIRAMKDGHITVGGARSRGLGLVTLDDLQFQFINGAADLIEYLDNKSSSDQVDSGLTDEQMKPWIGAFRERLKGVAGNVQAAR